MTSVQNLCGNVPVIAILRGITEAEITDICDVLFRAGVHALEIPLNTPNAIRIIATAVNHCSSRQIVGAGTVLTPDEVNAVADAGGKFIISPNTDVSVISETVKRGLISIPGFLTPSEAFTAIAAGADFLKLFPAGNFGIDYVKNLQAVIKTPILAVGGIGPDNGKDFLSVCAGLGIGSAIFKPGDTQETVEKKAAALLAAIR